MIATRQTRTGIGGSNEIRLSSPKRNRFIYAVQLAIKAFLLHLRAGQLSLQMKNFYSGSTSGIPRTRNQRLIETEQEVGRLS